MGGGEKYMKLNKIDEAYMLEFLLTAMAEGPDEAAEEMERYEQRVAVRNVQLAKNMRPNKEEWEKLGFMFFETEDSVLYNAKLPEGWSIQKTEHSMWNDIVDDQGRLRATMFYKGSFYDRNAHMRLENRYGVRSEYIDNMEEIYFGSKNEKLFVAGVLDENENKALEESRTRWDRERELVKLAEEFGKENYPDYENPLAYWDETKEMIKAKNI